MNDFIDILERVGAEPMSWIVVGLVGLWVTWSLVRLVICPIANNRSTITPARAIELMNQKVRHPLSYLLFMLGGMAMAVMGLFGLAGDSSHGVLPLALLAIGLMVILTLPARYRIKDSELRVIAARAAETRSIMCMTLRQEHRQLLMLEAGVLVMLTAVLLLY